MKRLLPLLPLALLAVGCSGGGDSGDVEGAKKASAAVPQSADQLPADMKPEKKAEATAGIESQKAMAAQMNAQYAGRSH